MSLHHHPMTKCLNKDLILSLEMSLHHHPMTECLNKDLILSPEMIDSFFTLENSIKI